MRKSFTVIVVSVLLASGAVLSAAGQTQKLKTPAEEAAYTRYTQNEDIADFLSRAAAACGTLKVRTVGRSLPASDYGARDIFLVILTETGAAEPAGLDRGKPTVLVTASQHGNEQSAKEAALQVIAEAASGELRHLLKKLNLLVMPQTNPYGNFFDTRTNELELDMNRDHVKLESEGVKAIHRVFREWMPEATIDVHEKGDDYYRVSIGCVSNLNISRSLQDYSRRVVLAEVEKSLSRRNFAFHEYLVSEELGLDTSSGAAVPGRQPGREMMMRYSTTDLNDGRNSLGIFETLSFIQEGASRHDIATLRDRTRWQYAGLRAFLESVAGHAEEVKELVRGLRSSLTARAERRDPSDLVHLKMRYVRDPDRPELVLKQFDTTETSPVRGVLKVDKKAGEPLFLSDIAPYPEPTRRKVVTAVVKNWFPEVESRLSVGRPVGYIIPGRHLDVVETLLNLGVEVMTFGRDQELEVEAYRALEVVPSSADYLAPQKLEVERFSTRLVAKRGDFYVACAQPAANLIPVLLEPQSDYGLIRYWKYRLVPEAGDVFAFYRLDKPAEMRLVPYKAW